MLTPNSEYNAGIFYVRHSYSMAKELAHADAQIRQRHFESQRDDPEYWEKDRAMQAEDGVVADPETGQAIPILNIVAPDVLDPHGSKSLDQWEQKQREHDATTRPVEVSEVERNGASIMDMVKAGPKILSAMLKPSDSPMALKRLEVCRGCEHWTGSKCRKCGCFTSLKVRLPGEACPIGKWSKEE
jgi:hypothetical protein